MSMNFSWPRVNSALPPSSPLHPSNPTGCNQNKGSLTSVSNHCSPLLRVQPVPSTTRKWAMQGRSCNTGALRCPATGCRALSVSLETETLLEAESMLSCSVPSTQKGLSAGTGWGIRLKSSQKCYRKVGCNRPQITLFIFQWIPLALPLLCSCPLLPSVNTHQILTNLFKEWELPGLHLHLLISVLTMVFRYLFQKGRQESLTVKGQRLALLKVTAMYKRKFVYIWTSQTNLCVFDNSASWIIC